MANPKGHHYDLAAFSKPEFVFPIDSLMKKKTLKICILSKADAFGGGASKCAEDLSTQLNQAGHDVRHYCYWAGKGFNAIRYPLIGKYFKPVFLFREKIEKKLLGLPDLIPFELPSLLKRGILDFDILHFHDICSAFSPLTVHYLARRKPVIWTLHDCSPFTGGCLYPMGCEKFTKQCVHCPQKQWPIDSPFTRTALLQKVKRRIFSNTNIVLTTPSKWMAQTAIRSSALNRKPIVINNGVNTSLFQPMDKFAARLTLSIPTDRYVILLSAAAFRDERKGAIYAFNSIQKIKDQNPYVLLMGDVPSKLVQTHLQGIETKILGYQSDTKNINTIYASADVFLFPSLADNQPLSILEAFASGTPVISFDTGGIPEMIDHHTGTVVKAKDTDALAQALIEFSDKRFCAKAAILARKKAEDNYQIEYYTKNHLHLYRMILER